MLGSFLDYKIKQFEALMSSENLREDEKQQTISKINTFLNTCVKVDEDGRLIISKELVQELMTAIKKGEIPLTITEQDMMISIGYDLPNSPNYPGTIFEDLNDVVAIHISPIIPSNDVIRTQESTGVTKNMSFVDPKTGIEHTVPYLVGKDTIHFTLNCTVSNHQSGNDWDSYKYGVLVDFDKLDKSKILDTKSEDTYVDGDAKLGIGYYLFCPLGDREKVSKNNSGAIIIEYDGIDLKDAISAMIIFTGHKLEPYGTYGWGRNDEYGREVSDVQRLEELVSRYGYPVLKGEFGNALHSETEYMARRMWKMEYEALLSLMDYNKNNSIDMPEDVLLSTMIYGGAFSLPGTVPVSIEHYREVVFPILEKHGYRVDNSLLEGIVEDDNKKYILDSGSGIPYIQCPIWENELRSRVIGLVKNNTKNDSGPKL